MLGEIEKMWKNDSYLGKFEGFCGKERIKNLKERAKDLTV